VTNVRAGPPVFWASCLSCCRYRPVAAFEDRGPREHRFCADCAHLAGKESPVNRGCGNCRLFYDVRALGSCPRCHCGWPVITATAFCLDRARALMNPAGTFGCPAEVLIDWCLERDYNDLADECRSFLATGELR
jgi:hypothetical protein